MEEYMNPREATAAPAPVLPAAPAQPAQPAQPAPVARPEPGPQTPAERLQHLARSKFGRFGHSNV